MSRAGRTPARLDSGGSFIGGWEVASSGRDEIDPQHLLLAVISEAGTFFVDPDRMKADLMENFPPFPKRRHSELPLGPAAVRIFERAAANVRVEPMHILAAVMAEDCWASFNPETTSSLAASRAAAQDGIQAHL
jgi:hypothetical protein